MQVIIPMSGFGQRFRRAGYTVPKPLIEIDGKPVIGHVIDMFPGEHEFIFICNQDHLDNPAYRMEMIIRQYCPTGQILGIAPHKRGPVHAVLQAAHLLDPERAVMVNYCDFTCYWDWHHFKTFVSKTCCDGAIPAYKGFHPHTLGSTNYAYLRESDGWVLDIQEKKPYTCNRMEEFASTGSYYFASGELLCNALRETIEQNLNVDGEYYVSLAYNPMLRAGRTVAVYPIQHFMQWGTPEDVAEYQGWSTAFKRLSAPEDIAVIPDGSVIVPMAGMGERFAKEGYEMTKPLIQVSGAPMVIQATRDLPAASHYLFVLRSAMAGHEAIAAELTLRFPGAFIASVSAQTEGQACTARVGLAELKLKIGGETGRVTFGACDNGAIYNAKALQAMLANPEIDVIVWGVRGHADAARRPEMYGWIDADEGLIRTISVKTPLGSPSKDPIVLGTFTFRRAADFEAAVDRLIARNGRTNNEFYIDACINDAVAIGLRCHLFEVDHFLSWGTPNDLRSFEYWQSCFHKWSAHPYRLELDARISPCEAQALELRYCTQLPELPALSKPAVCGA